MKSFFLFIALVIIARSALAEDVNTILLSAIHADDANLVFEALEGGANPNYLIPGVTLGTGEPVIIEAALTAHAPVVQELLNYGSNPDTVNAYGDNALHELYGYCPQDDEFRYTDPVVLSEADRIANINLLLTKTQNINLASTDQYQCRFINGYDSLQGLSPFILALLSGDANILATLNSFPNLPVNALVSDETPLRYAVGSPANISWLLQRGADPNTVNSKGRTVIHYLVENTTVADADVNTALDLLVQAKIDINHLSTAGETALQLAVSKNRIAVVQKLLSLNADPNLNPTPSLRPLVVAASNGYADIIKSLIASPVNMKQDGSTAILAALNHMNTAVAQQLVDAGADVNGLAEPDSGSPTFMFNLALQNAISDENRVSLVSFYTLNHGNLEPSGIMTPLMLSAQNSWSLTVTSLLQVSASPNTVYLANTAMTYALNAGNCAIANSIAGAQLNPNLPSPGTVASLAINKGCFATIGARLISLGAQLKGLGLLQAAVNQKDDVSLELLLNASVDPNELVYGTPALVEAILADWTDGLHSLINHGADPNTSVYGTPALDYTTSNKHSDLTDLLLKAVNLNVNLLDGSGESAIFYETDPGRLASMVKLGAQLEIKASYTNMTALLTHVKNSEFQAIKALVEAGANVNAQDAQGEDAVQLATVNKDIPTVILLCKNESTDPSCNP